jgi:hypothetical protein
MPADTMVNDTIRCFLGSEPFVPFRIRLADGRSFMIDDPADVGTGTGGYLRIHDELVNPADVIVVTSVVSFDACAAESAVERDAEIGRAAELLRVLIEAAGGKDGE